VEAGRLSQLSAGGASRVSRLESGVIFDIWFRPCRPRYKRSVESRILIDSIVRQTTLLIAQLATSAGIRAPLAHLADQVFLELSREIEQQGVTRKVAADMFGLALRRYQRKVNRLRESVSFSERTLWQAMLEFVTERGSVTRSELAVSFKRDDEADVAAVLNDLVASGLLYCTGRGRSAAYRSTSQSDREHMAAERTLETLTHLVWLSLAVPGGLTREELMQRFPEQAAQLDAALAALLDDGRAERIAAEPAERFHSKRVMIAVGSEAGWESAVFDHFRAVCTALANKVRLGGAAAAAQTSIGGTTLSFDLTPEHPHAEEVKGLLTRVRADAFEVWKRVSAYNAKHPPPEDRLERVIFYAGQNYIGSDLNGEAK
jgi:hypothetical protein